MKNFKESHPHLEARYFERMAKSLQDKIKIVEHLPNVVPGAPAPTVLDIGAGGGEFANTLSEMGYNVTAIDASDDAVMRIRESFPHITTAKLLANHVDNLGLEKFDAVVCSSILHEVFSYGDDSHGKGDYDSLDSAFHTFFKVLKPGGRIIIRDGVLPVNWNDKGTITLLDGHEEYAVFIYLKMCPFSNGYSETNGDLVNLNKIAPKTFEGNVRSLLEFSYTYTWGFDSYPRETQELYAVKTLDEYCELLSKHGFTVTHAEEYLQPGYPAHLKDMIRLNVNDVEDEWFNSNAIWVAEKPRR